VCHKRGARSPCLCRGTARANTSTQIRLAGPELPQDFFRAEPCWHRRRPARCWKRRDGGSITPQLVAKLHQARQRAALQLQSTCEGAKEALLVCGSGRFLAAMEVRQLAIASGCATASTRESCHHPLAAPVTGATSHRAESMIRPALTSDLCAGPGTKRAPSWRPVSATGLVLAALQPFSEGREASSAAFAAPPLRPDGRPSSGRNRPSGAATAWPPSMTAAIGPAPCGNQQL